MLLFTMLAGETPFASGPEDSPEDILQRIGKGQYDMNSGNWLTVSSLAKDIVTKMLDVNPSRRLTTGQILAHPWMTSRNQPTTNLLRQDSQHLKVKLKLYNTILIYSMHIKFQLNIFPFMKIHFSFFTSLKENYPIFMILHSWSFEDGIY